MDFGSWSPAHTILTLFIVAGFVWQVAVYFYRTAQNDKKIDKQGETFFHAIERFEERMDKRLAEMEKRIDEVNQHVRAVRTKLNQNHVGRAILNGDI